MLCITNYLPHPPQADLLYFVLQQYLHHLEENFSKDHHPFLKGKGKPVWLRKHM
jgi:hypothetical protein